MRLGDVDTGRLREALAAADYTYDGVTGLLGPLARLWPLQSAVRAADADAALPGLVEQLCHAGVLERSGDEVAARLDLRPYAADDRDLWVLSDLTPGLSGRPVHTRPDYVLGVSPTGLGGKRITPPAFE